MTGSQEHRPRGPRRRGVAAALAVAVAIPAAILLAGCASPTILRPEGSAGRDILTLAIEVFSHPRLRAPHRVDPAHLRDRPLPQAPRVGGVPDQGQPAHRDHLDADPGHHRHRPVRPHGPHDAADRDARPGGPVHLGRPPVVVGVRLLQARLQDRQRGLRAAEPRGLHRPPLHGCDPLVLGAADGRQGGHDPRARQPHPLRAAHDRPVPRRVRRVLRRAARQDALPLRRRHAGAVHGLGAQPAAAGTAAHRRRRRSPASRSSRASAAAAATPSAARPSRGPLGPT